MSIITKSTSKLFSAMEIAELLQVQRRTVYAWIRQRKLVGVRAGNRVRVTEKALDDFLQSTQ